MNPNEKLDKVRETLDCYSAIMDSTTPWMPGEVDDILDNLIAELQYIRRTGKTVAEA